MRRGTCQRSPPTRCRGCWLRTCTRCGITVKPRAFLDQNTLRWCFARFSFRRGQGDRTDLRCDDEDAGVEVAEASAVLRASKGQKRLPGWQHCLYL